MASNSKTCIYLLILLTALLLLLQGCSFTGSGQEGNAPIQTTADDNKGNIDIRERKTDVKVRTDTASNIPSGNTGSPGTNGTDKPKDENPKGQTTPAPALTPSPIPTGAANAAKPKKTVPILYYHSINDNITGIEELFVSPSEFEKQMNFLKKNNYNIITFDQLDKAASIENPVIITLDDGYEDNYFNAYPILKKNNFKATIFLCSDFIDKPSILKTTQIKEMTDLINFQGHSISHPDLRTLSRDEIEKELFVSKEIIEGITGQKVDVFAYPTGYYNNTVLEITRKYYKYAVLNGGGLYTEGDGNYETRRVYIPRNLDIQGFEKKIKGLK